MVAGRQMNKRVELYLASPLYGGMCHAVYKNSQLALMHYLAAHGFVAHFVDETNDALIPRGRNKLANAALETEMTHLVFWDGDTGITAQGIIEMVTADKPVIAAPVSVKTTNWQAVRQILYEHPEVTDAELEGASGRINFNRKAEGLDVDGIDLSQPMRVLDQGTGVMVIQREVLEEMIRRFPDEWYYENWSEPRGKKLYDFFPNGIDKKYRQYLPEDYGFCRRWASIGGEVYLAPWIKTLHAGTKVYSGNLVDIARFLMCPEESLLAQPRWA